MVGLQVAPDSHVIGKSVEEAGLRGLDRLYLASVRCILIQCAWAASNPDLCTHKYVFLTTYSYPAGVSVN